MTATLPLPRASDAWAFFLDIDGTLIEHAERPDAVRTDPAVVQLLAGLRAASGGAVALISGRAIAAVDALFTPLRLPVAGLHGIERRDALGKVHSHSFAEAPLRRVAERLAAVVSRHPGLVFEDKGLALALHYRQTPQLKDFVQEIAASVAAELGEEFEVLHGKMVIEIKPGGRNKGAAIEEFLGEAPFRGRMPAFVGDDVTDEFGFTVVNRLGGHSVKVGAGASAARWRLANAEVVRDWLARCTGEMHEVGGAA